MKEREEERKWKHVFEKIHQGEKMGIVHILKQHQAHGVFVSQGQEKLNLQGKNLGKWGFTGMNTF